MTSTTASSLETVRTLLRETLQLGGRADGFDHATPLFGSLPELDSMAVVTVITALEERLGIVVEDDDINAAVFATLGSLAEYVDQKLAS